MNTEASPSDSTRLLKSAECSSLSGAITLTYEIGVQGEADLAIRLAGSTGGGLYNDNWVPMANVLDLLKGMSTGSLVTAKSMRALYPGKSVNSAGYALKALINEGAVRPTQGKRYEVGDLDVWVASLHDLMQSEAKAVPVKAIPRSKKVSTPKKEPSDANS